MKQKTKLQVEIQLNLIYEAIRQSGFQCKGLCQSNCVEVPMMQIESDKLGIPPRNFLEFTAKELDEGGHQCQFLGVMGQCSVYENRPFVCRAFGAFSHPEIRCKHGCPPTLNMEGSDELLKHYLDLMDFEFAKRTGQRNQIKQQSVHRTLAKRMEANATKN